MDIIPLQKKHYPAVAAIYQEGIVSGIATFETEIPNWEQWNEKFLSQHRWIVQMHNEVAAWAALSTVSKRSVYRGVAENTIYVAQKFQNKGIGKRLLQHLIVSSESDGFWTLQAGIFPQNKASIKLHEACGFRVIGVREKIAQRDGQWHDNILMERRSKLDIK